MIWSRGVNPGGFGGHDPPEFGLWVVGVAGWVVDGSWNIIICYHVQEVCSKVVTFEEKYRVICSEVAVNEQFCLENRIF